MMLLGKPALVLLPTQMYNSPLSPVDRQRNKGVSKFVVNSTTCSSDNKSTRTKV
jgi:hypothetical protein